MTVDYRLQERFETSVRAREAARRALPDHWREDPRPEAQEINDVWVGIMVRMSERHVPAAAGALPSVGYADDLLPGA